MMTEIETLNYFLLPHMTLSEAYFRNLLTFLPRLNVLEIVRKALIPEWAPGRISGWPVRHDDDLLSKVGASIEAHRAFAQVHGGPGGILGFLSGTFEEIDQNRFRIQEELRGKITPEMSSAQKGIFQAALFLEIACERDQKELEVESGYTRLSAMEQEFREILGIGDDEFEQAQANLTQALTPDVNGLLYMLSKRIESWFRIFSLSSPSPPETVPIFVTCFPEVIEEVMEMVRTACERNERKFSEVSYKLGSVPGMDLPGSKQLGTVIETPVTFPPGQGDPEVPMHQTVRAVPELLSCCRRGLEDFIRSVAERKDVTLLEHKRSSLQNDFEKLRRECVDLGSDEVNLGLTVVENVSLADITGFPAASPEFEAGSWPLVFLSITARQ